MIIEKSHVVDPKSINIASLINFDTYNHFVQVSPNQSSAVVTFNVDGEYIFKGIKTDYAVRVSFFWTKINGEWKKMHSHWSSRSGSTGIPINDR